MKDSTCFSYDNLTIGGYWDSNFTNYVTINVKPCFDTINCANFSEFIKFISSKPMYMTFYTLQHFINLDNYTEPLRLHLLNIYNILDLKLSKKLTLIYKQTNMSVDSGSVILSKNEYSVFSSDEIYTDYNIIPDGNYTSNLIEYNLFFKDGVDIYEIHFMNSGKFLLQ